MLGLIKHEMQGKTTRSKPDAVGTKSQKIDVPRSIMKFYKDAELKADVMRVNDVTFLTTMSSDIHYGTIEVLKTLKCASLEFELKNVVISHAVKGFRIAIIVVDTHFKSLKDRNLLGVVVNVVSKEEHASKDEHGYRVITEREHCHCAILSFDYLPRMMVVHLMKKIVFYVNAFVWKRGVSQIMPPLTIVECAILDYALHFRVIFGEHT